MNSRPTLKIWNWIVYVFDQAASEEMGVMFVIPAAEIDRD